MQENPLPQISSLIQLQTIEDELSELIRKTRINWIRTAQILVKVELEKLHESTGKSYTQYVQGLAKQNHINVSTLWRAKSALVLYMELNGLTNYQTVHPLEVLTTPEQLESFSKVRTIAPEKIIEEVKQKMLSGESVRNELKLLWQTYSPLKKGKTERGRKPKDPNEGEATLKTEKKIARKAKQFVIQLTEVEQQTNKNVALGSYTSVFKDDYKLKKYNVSHEQLEAANLINSLHDDAWVRHTIGKSGISRFNVFLDNTLEDLHEVEMNIDLLAVCKHIEQPKNELPLVFGVSICIDVKELVFDNEFLAHLAFCNFYYVAIPNRKALLEKALVSIDNQIGIISLSDSIVDGRHELKIIRKALKTNIQLPLAAQLFGQILMKLLK